MRNFRIFNNPRRRIVFLAILVLLIILVGIKVTASQAQYSLSGSANVNWNVISGGGQINSTGGGYSLSGATGQSLVSYALEGTPYALQSGFWVETYPYQVFLPAVKR